MMESKAAYTTLLLMGFLSACTCQYIPKTHISNPFYRTPAMTEKPAPFADYNFAYDIESPNPIKLAQVFDDKKFTYFTFSSALKGVPNITLAGTYDLIPVTQKGTYWKIQGVYPKLRVASEFDDAAVFVVNNGDSSTIDSTQGKGKN